MFSHPVTSRLLRIYSKHVTLPLIDVHGDVHGEHSERESNINQSEVTELCEAAYEPRETEDNRPCDSDSNYIYDEGHTFRTPVPPRGETCKCKHDGSPMTYPVRVCIVYDLFMRAITYLYLDITFVEGLDVF